MDVFPGQLLKWDFFMELSSLVKRLCLGKSLGAGAFAVVHQATYDGQPVAVKVLSPQCAPSPRDDCALKMLIREGQLLQNVHHRCDKLSSTHQFCLHHGGESPQSQSKTRGTC
jgi:hypothetical protein